MPFSPSGGGNGFGAGMGMRPGAGPKGVASGVPFVQPPVQYVPSATIYSINSGSITAVGTAIRAIATGVLGTSNITPAGSAIRAITTGVLGSSSITAAGSLIKQAQKVLTAQIIGFGIFPYPTGAGPQYVQSAQGTGSGGVVLPTAPVQNNLLIAIMFSNSSEPVTGSGWTPIVGSGSSTPPCRAVYKIAGSGESTTQTPTSTPLSNVCIFEFFSPSGWPSNPVDKTDISSSSSMTPPSVSSAILNVGSANDCAVVACYSTTAADSPPTNIGLMSLTLSLQGGDTNGNGAAAYQTWIGDIPGTTETHWTQTATWSAGSTAGLATIVTILITPANYTSTLSTGSITPAGSIKPTVLRALASASMTMASAMNRFSGINLAGSITAAGSALEFISAILSGGSVTPTGSVAKSTRVPLAGSITPGGSLALAFLKTLSGSITAAGSETVSVSALLSSSLTLAGSESKKLSRAITGSLVPGGTINRLAEKSLAAVVIPLGTISKQAQDVFTASVTPISSFSRQVAARLTGSIAPAGSIQRSIVETFVGAIAPVGTERRMLSRTLAQASVTAAGAVGKATSAILQTGSIQITGAVSAVRAKILSSIISIAGTLVALLKRNRVTKTINVELPLVLLENIVAPPTTEFSMLNSATIPIVSAGTINASISTQENLALSVVSTISLAQGV